MSSLVEDFCLNLYSLALAIQRRNMKKQKKHKGIEERIGSEQTVFSLITKTGVNIKGYDLIMKQH
jgi:hypothetical protein